jgi:hypothetical protein
MHHILFQTCFYMYYFFIRSQLLLSSKKPAENRPELAKYVLSQFFCRYVDVPTTGTGAIIEKEVIHTCRIICQQEELTVI